MNQGRTDRDWAIVAVMAFIAGAVVAWAITSDRTVAKLMADIEWPAWVQAIGSIAAIAVAVYVPWRQRQHAIDDQKRLERNKIRIMAAALAAAAGQYRGSLAAAYSFLERDHEGRKGVPSTGIRRPIEFDQFRSELYLLGDYADKINRLIASHTTMSGAAQAIHDAPSLSPEFLRFARRQFPAMIELATTLSRELRIIGKE